MNEDRWVVGEGMILGFFISLILCVQLCFVISGCTAKQERTKAIQAGVGYYEANSDGDSVFIYGVKK
jgi:hypothetical protein